MDKAALYKEKELLLQTAEGNADAFSRLFHMYAGKLYGYLFQLTRSSDAARDITQDVFLKIWQSRSRLADIDSFNDYVFIAARNQAYSFLKKETRINNQAAPVLPADAMDATADMLRNEKFHLTVRPILKWRMMRGNLFM